MVHFPNKLSSQIVAFMLTLLSTDVFAGTTKSVSTVTDFQKAIASAQFGDIIVVADGTYDLNGTVTITTSGKAGQPIVLKSKNRNRAILTGDSRFVLETAAHVIIEGFDFRSTGGPAIELRACNNIRVERNVFHLKDTKRANWVFINGSKQNPTALSHHNRIDHNLFENKSQLGNFITIEGTRTGNFQVSQYDTIDHNHFRDIGPRVENVLEAIRIGSSDFSLSSGYTLLERNLFERCDGDPEYISIKSSNNVIRYNTFRECLGSLSLRHGNRNTVEGNFILGNGRTGMFKDSTGKTWTLGTGGLRFYGDSMVIVNNYFEGLTGKKWDGTLAITSGNAEYGDGQPLTKHFRIRDAVIAFNTFVNNKTNIEVGYDGEGFQGNWWRLPPSGLTIANNLVVGSNDTLIKLYALPLNTTWEGNITYATQGAVVSGHVLQGVTEVNPQLMQTNGLSRLPKRSPAIDAAVGSFPFVKNDIDGQKRDNKKDVGADEFSTAKVINRPLTAKEVGPNAH